MTSFSPLSALLLRVVRVGACVFTVAFLLLGMFFATGEPQGFHGGMTKVLTGSQDLFMRHNEVRMILLGENPYQLALEDRLGERSIEVMGSFHRMDPDYFPSTLLPVLLMAWLPFVAVKWLWLCVSLASVVLLVQTLRWMLQPQLPSAANQATMVCLWICGIPFWSCLALGQASLFSVALTLAAFRADFTGRYWLAGVLLAFGVFKYALIWPLVLFFFILQWRWRCLFIGGGIHLVVHLVLCRIMHANPVTIFADVLGGNSKVFHASGTLTVWLPFRAWNQAFPHLALPAQLLGALLLLSLLGGLVWLWLRRKKTDRRDLIVWTAVFLLLAILTISSRIFAHMYALPVLLLACAPGPPALSMSRRVRLAAWVLYLGYVPNGLDDLGLPAHLLSLLRIGYNLVLAALVLDLGSLLLRRERARALN